MGIGAEGEDTSSKLMISTDDAWVGENVTGSFYAGGVDLYAFIFFMIRDSIVSNN